MQSKKKKKIKPGLHLQERENIEGPEIVLLPPAVEFGYTGK